MPGAGIAGVSLGPKGAEELKKLGKPYRNDRGMSQTRQVWKRLSARRTIGNVLHSHRQQRSNRHSAADGVTIDLIRSTNAQFRTAGGIAVGSTLEQIRKSFPDGCSGRGNTNDFR